MDRFKPGSKSGWKLGLLLTVILCFGVITFIYPLDTVRAQSKLAGKEVIIGVAFGETGHWRDWIRKNKIAVEMAVEEINAMGGIGGVPMRAIIRDTASKPQEAARAIRKLTEDDKALAIVGPLSSSECEVAFPVGNRMGISMIAFASSKPGIAAANRPYGFRNTMDEVKMGLVAVKAFMNTKDAVSRALGTKVLPMVFKKLGANIINEGNYVTFQTKDFDFGPQVTKLKGMDFDGIAFGGLYFDGVTFLKEMRRQGLTQNIVGGSPLIHENFPKVGGKAANGTFAPSTFHYSIAPTRFVSEFSKRAKAKGFDIPEPIMYDVNVYDSFYFIKDAIERMGVTNRPEDLAKDREKIMKGLTNIKDFRGIVGPVAFNKVGDGHKPIYVAVIQDGVWVVQK
jgi:branched-chain amino acid transport system substrate-binding protein